MRAMGRVVTIAAGASFLDGLAEQLLAAGEDRLADTLLLLPSRRACLAARDAFLRVGGGRTLLLPRLLPVGEPDEVELRIDPASELELEPALAPLRRWLLLTRLVLARDPGLRHEQAIRLAQELLSLLDELQTEEVGLDGLDRLVPDELAEHWQTTLRFLAVLREVWPRLLGELGMVEPAERRRALLDALSRRWSETPPPGPVVAAGMVGTVPAVGRLLATVAGLPQGLLVLPGLDLEMAASEWRAIGPSHPQHGLKRLLERIGVERSEVSSWPPLPPIDRSALWRATMATTVGERSGDSGRVVPESALEGLERVEADDLGQEAVELALRLREALEVPGRRAVLVTADRNLARRVAIELARFDIAVDDSAGLPLDQTPPGSFLLLTAHVLVSEAPPVPLLSALKHPLAQGGLDRGEFRRRVRALERGLLRGPRIADGLTGLRAELAQRCALGRWAAPVPGTELLAWLDGILDAARPALDLVARGVVDPVTFLDAHLAFAEALAADAAGDPGELWAREAGVALATFVAELRDALPELGPVPVTAWPALLAVTMASRSVRRRAPGHPRLAILGRLESRLASADLVLLGGLVEGAWPPSVEAGPWLNRAMRRSLGLPPVEQAIGIAAHDFVQLASAPRVVLSHSRKDEAGQPTSRSRWLVRLDAVLAGQGAAGRLAPSPGRRAWPRLLDEPRELVWPQPIARPMPRPPRELRPRELWVSDLRDLMRDPYAVYARRILGLVPLEPIDADAGAAERGELLHRALQRFVEALAGTPDRDPRALLLEIGRSLFAAEDHRPQIGALWWPRFEALAGWLADQDRARREQAERILAELEGTLRLEAPGGPVHIRARADRIEVGRDGRVAILDYKSGRLPKKVEVEAGLEPQLPVEALIAEEGGFPGVPAAEVVELVFLGLRGGDPPGETRSLEMNEDLRRATRAGLARLVAHFDDPSTAYVPVPRLEIAPGPGDYEHLARVREWRGAEIAEADP